MAGSNEHAVTRPLPPPPSQSLRRVPPQTTYPTILRSAPPSIGRSRRARPRFRPTLRLDDQRRRISRRRALAPRRGCPVARAAAARRFATATPASTTSSTIEKAGVPWRSSDSRVLPPLSAGSGRASSPRSSVNAESASSNSTRCSPDASSKRHVVDVKGSRAVAIAGRGEFAPRRHHSIAIRRQCNSFLQAAD